MVKLSDYKLPVKQPTRNFPMTQASELPMSKDNK